MGLGWDSVFKLSVSVFSILDAVAIIFFFNAGSIDPFWLVVMLILLVLGVIVTLVSFRALRRVEKELTS